MFLITGLRVCCLLFRRETNERAKDTRTRDTRETRGEHSSLVWRVFKVTRVCVYFVGSHFMCLFFEVYCMETRADEQELATPIQSLCHGTFTD